MLHPQVEPSLAMRAQPPPEVLAAGPYRRLVFARAAMEESVEAECGPAVPLAVVADLDAGGVPARLYATSADAPVLVYAHGGSWMAGSIETVDRMCRRIADRSGCAVLSVGYRLAPEHTFPAALEDVETVVEHVRREGAALGVDPARLAIGGDSAGGLLATVVARRQRDAGTPLDQQVLINPVIDPTMSSPSYDEVAGWGMDRAAVREAWDTFAPEVALRYTPDLAPLAADLAGMPSTLLITAEYDVLRDEGADYADALIAAGVPVVHVRYLGMNHGFARKLAVFDAARACVDQVAAFLRAALTF